MRVSALVTRSAGAGVYPLLRLERLTGNMSTKVRSRAQGSADQPHPFKVIKALTARRFFPSQHFRNEMVH